jgi:NADH:ubiquinone oxidoreductase subunit
VINFLKQIFTWWHKQTLGTFIYTLFTGKIIGRDQFGNKYYSNSKGRRWVIYKDNIESSKIPPDWHSWIHFLKINKPSTEEKKFLWQKQYEENLTGTDRAYKPEGSLTSSLKKNMKKYEIWKP